MLSPEAVNYAPSGKPPTHNSFTFQSFHINSNLNYGSAFNFVFPKSTRFYDLKCVMLRARCSIVDNLGEPLPADSGVFFKGDGIGGLFERVSVAFNAECVSTEERFSHLCHMYNLISFRRNSKLVDLGFVCKTWSSVPGSSNLAEVNQALFAPALDDANDSKVFVIDGLLSPFLLSATQLLPTQTEVNIQLERAPDALVIGCLHPVNRPQLKIHSITAIVKTWDLTPTARSLAESTLTPSGLMPFHCHRAIPMTIPTGTSEFFWPNVFSSKQLCDIMYLAFMKHHAFVGSYSTLPCFFEDCNVRAVSFTVNQSPIVLGGQYSCDFTRVADDEGRVHLRDKGAAREPYYALLELMGVADGRKSAAPLDFDSFQNGNIFYAARIPSAFGACRSTDPLDVRVSFRTPLEEPYTAILFTRATAHVSVDKDRNYFPIAHV